MEAIPTASHFFCCNRLSLMAMANSQSNVCVYSIHQIMSAHNISISNMYIHIHIHIYIYSIYIYTYAFGGRSPEIPSSKKKGLLPAAFQSQESCCALQQQLTALGVEIVARNPFNSTWGRGIARGNLVMCNTYI